MSTVTPNHDVSKLLSAAENVVIRNHRYQHVRLTDKPGSIPEKRESGRLNKSIQELQLRAEEVRKSKPSGEAEHG